VFFSALRSARFASFSFRFICKAFSRSRFAIVVFPARAMVPSLVKVEQSVSVVLPHRYPVGAYSVAPRRLTLLEPGWWFLPGALLFCSVERERVPCPNPRLASEDTSRLMVSIEVEDSSVLGSDKPSSSQRILGL
jgi:hypothetical protein